MLIKYCDDRRGAAAGYHKIAAARARYVGRIDAAMSLADWALVHRGLPITIATRHATPENVTPGYTIRSSWRASNMTECADAIGYTEMQPSASVAVFGHARDTLDDFADTALERETSQVAVEECFGHPLVVQDAAAKQPGGVIPHGPNNTAVGMRQRLTDCGERFMGAYRLQESAFDIR
jgi:hypothetical protein